MTGRLQVWIAPLGTSPATAPEGTWALLGELVEPTQLGRSILGMQDVLDEVESGRRYLPPPMPPSARPIHFMGQVRVVDEDAEVVDGSWQPEWFPPPPACSQGVCAGSGWYGAREDSPGSVPTHHHCRCGKPCTVCSDVGYTTVAEDGAYLPQCYRCSWPVVPGAVYETSTWCSAAMDIQDHAKRAHNEEGGVKRL